MFITIEKYITFIDIIIDKSTNFAMPVVTNN